MYEFTHILTPRGTFYPNEVFVRCTYMDEYGQVSTGISIQRESIPELINYLQSIISEEES